MNGSPDRSEPYVYLARRGGMSVWLAQESPQRSGYLLCVLRGPVSETYRRYSLGDIQCVTVRKTGRTLGGAVSWAIVAIIYASILGLAEATSLIAWAFEVIPIAALIWLMCLGESCVCEIQTAVSMQTLGGVATVRAARRLVEAMGPQVQARQGELTEQMVPGLATAGARREATSNGQQAAGSGGGAAGPVNPGP